MSTYRDDFYRHPELYDLEYASMSEDVEYYLALARRSNRLIELACGTGRLSIPMAQTGAHVTAVDLAAPPFSGVVVGLVLAADPHPNAEKLRVCRVDVGQGEPLQIVCGAANVAAGMRVPAALVGAVLPGGFKIKRAKLRGVESLGMICSASELGLGGLDGRPQRTNTSAGGA